MESRRVIKRPLSDEEISRLVVVRGKAHSFNGDPGMFLLAAEAERIRIAYQFDPLFAVNSSIVDPLPHQVEAVYRYLLPLPRIRFLLAEDHMGLRTTSPSYLLNCVPPENNPELPDLPERSVEEIQSFAYEKITEGQFEEVKAARVEECNLRRDYLNNAFADLIMELQGELNDLQQASLFGDQNADERARLERRIEELKNRKAERLSELQLMERLTGNLPDVLTQAVVMPPPVAVMETDEATPGQGLSSLPARNLTSSVS